MAAALLAGVIGAALGSFLNVCRYRIPRGISILRRSTCDACGAELRWFELAPLVSQIALGGRCRNCHKKISLMYPATELLSGAIAVILFIRYGASFEWLYWLTFSLSLVLIAQIDYSHLLIPNKVLIVAAVIIAVLKGMTVRENIVKDALAALILMGAAYLFIWGFSKIIKKQAMGIGDVKLMGFVTFSIGWESTLIAIWIAAVIGTIGASMLILLKKRTFDSKFPFGALIAVVSLILIPVQSNLKEYIEAWLI